MTYKDYFVVEVKSNGHILRVKDDSVHLPFGSEYSILLKNLNSKRASVKISIDGQDVLDYNSIVIGPNETSEIEGFLSGNVAKNKFKFIQKTDQIQKHRGDRIDDGIIRVEFAYEKPKPQILLENKEQHHHHYHYHSPIYGGTNWWSYTDSNTSDGSSVIRSCFNVNEETVQLNSQSVAPKQDEGITVKGSEINDIYQYTSIGELEDSQVIVIKLIGVTQSGSISKPVTVKTKLQCSSCGTKSKSSFKFCPNCGTFLE